MRTAHLSGPECIGRFRMLEALKRRNYAFQTSIDPDSWREILMYHRILVPVDLTEKSMASVDVAYEFAAQSKAEVILLHVIETIEHIQFDELKPFYGRLEASARSGL